MGTLNSLLSCNLSAIILTLFFALGVSKESWDVSKACSSLKKKEKKKGKLTDTCTDTNSLAS